jgi:hypothetical protein
MTNKVKTTTDAVLNKAEVLLKDIEAASRGRRLRKAENEVKNAAKPKTFAGRGLALRQAEADVRPRQRRDARCLYSEMKPANGREPSKPNAKAVLIQAYRHMVDAVRR